MAHNSRGCRWWAVLVAGVLAAATGWSAGKGQDELGSTAAPSSAEFAAQTKIGVQRIPFMKTPPKLDGQLTPGEWEDSAACYGSWQCYVHDWAPNIAIEEKQPVWYLAYDKDYLYVAHRSPMFPRASWPLMKGKYHDVKMHPDHGILFDDQITFTLRPTTKEGGFFKFMCNPINTYVDLFKGIENTSEWDYRFRSKFDLTGKFDDDEWVTEWRIPLESFRYGPYDGGDPQLKVELPLRDDTMWNVTMSRWVGLTAPRPTLYSDRGYTWTGDSKRRLVFDSRGVTAQVTSFGKLQEDSMDLNIMLKNHGERSETVRVGFYLENEKELIVANEDEQFVELLPGEVKRIQMKKTRIGITPQNNAIWLDIRTLSGKIVYRDFLMTFHMIDGWPMYRENFVDSMKYIRPPRPPFGYDYAYYPSVNKLRAIVDTDIFGPAEAVKTALEAKVKLLSADDSVEVAVLTIPLEKPMTNAMAQAFGGRRGEAVVSFPKLKPGEYKTVCLLYDADKKIVGDLTTPNFTQASYPWEGNTEGLEDIVWKPYTPIEADMDGKRVKTLMHEIQLDTSGLPAQIAIRGKNPNYGPQLRAPLRLETTADGKRSIFAATGTLSRVKDWQSEQVFEARGAAGPVQIRGQAQYDCDGTLTYDFWYRSGTTPIETLELVLDLAGPVDLLAYRGTGWHVKGDEVLGRKGPVVWNSLDDTVPKEIFYGNFTPSIQIGNGDRGFIWACDTDRGMKLLAEKAAMQIEKNEAGEYTLRVFIVNEPGPVSDERHVQFALMTQPDRPKPAGYRTFMWSKEAGAWGGGPHFGDGNTAYSIHVEHEEDYEKFAALCKGRSNRPYTDAVTVGFDMPGYRDYCYAGEFSGSQLIRPHPQLSPPEARHPVTGRPFGTIFAQSTAPWRWSPAQVNCAVYWRSKQIRQGFVNGFFWDDGFIGELSTDPVVGNAYDLPKHKFHAAGHQQYGFNFMLPRQFFKRLARISAKAGLDCASNGNGSVGPPLFAGAYFRDNLMVEGEGSYVTLESPHLRCWTLAETRYFTEPYSGRIGYYRSNIGSNPSGPPLMHAGDNPMHDRSQLAYALMHDAGVIRASVANSNTWEAARAALETFGYFTEDAATVEYIPYWRSDAYYQYGLGAPKSDDAFADEDAKGLAEQLKKVYGTIYKNRKTGKALLVLANGTGESITQNLVIKPLLLDGRPARTCTDVEVNEGIELSSNPKNAAKRMVNTFNPIHIAPWQFRLLMVE